MVTYLYVLFCHILKSTKFVRIFGRLHHHLQQYCPINFDTLIIMKRYPIAVFLTLVITSLYSGACSYRNAENKISEDANNALKLTLAEMPQDVVSADTIRCYRNHLKIAELKDTACIAMRTVRKGDRQETEMVADANCSFITVFKLSDQKESSAILFAGLLWIFGSIWYMRKYKPELLSKGLAYGNIIFANNKFMTANGQQIRLTPMQHSLLEMFLVSESHSLTKQEICDRLWPKKPDANDTLYTLIRRLKPIIESNSNLKIESDRGEGYSLEIR